MEQILYKAFLVGILPAISMSLAGIFSSLIQLDSTMESTSQNYCAGLILGAVAMELFPQMLSLPSNDSFLGMTIGFVIALVFLNGLDYIVNMVENYFDKKGDRMSSSSSVADYICK